MGKILQSKKVVDGYVIQFEGWKNSYALDVILKLGSEYVRLVPSAFDEKFGWWIANCAAGNVFALFENGKEKYYEMMEDN